MARKDEQKRERFCQLLADGMNQVEAYGAAGYRQSASGASRMANEPEIRARVEELRQEHWAARNGLAGDDPRSIVWLGHAYFELYHAARRARKYNEALKAVENIAKLIQLEERLNQTAASKPVSASGRVDIAAMAGVLDRVGNIVIAAKDNAALQSLSLIEIPAETDLGRAHRPE